MIYVIDYKHMKDKLYDYKEIISDTFKLIGIVTSDDISETFVVEIDNLQQLIELPHILGDDIVIYGYDSDIIMTKNCMRIMGLN